MTVYDEGGYPFKVDVWVAKKEQYTDTATGITMSVIRYHPKVTVDCAAYHGSSIEEVKEAIARLCTSADVSPVEFPQINLVQR